jgi:hypothetical protein
MSLAFLSDINIRVKEILLWPKCPLLYYPALTFEPNNRCMSDRLKFAAVTRRTQPPHAQLMTAPAVALLA